MFIYAAYCAVSTLTSFVLDAVDAEILEADFPLLYVVFQLCGFWPLVEYFLYMMRCFSLVYTRLNYENETENCFSKRQMCQALEGMYCASNFLLTLLLMKFY